MKLPEHRTKIVATIGPASRSREVMEAMILAGMNVARINLAHGDQVGHARAIANLRDAARSRGRRIAVMADLPGPKMRIGALADDKVELEPGALFTLTTRDLPGDGERVFVTFPRLPQVVRPGDTIYLNDALIQLEVLKAEGQEVLCRVIVGGELRSRKGLNLPGIDLGSAAFTEQDRKWLKFASEQGIDAVSQSFVEGAADVLAVRKAAAEMGYAPFIIAKIERAAALDHLEEILAVADGIMVARGDLGVEIPIERIALVQKRLIRSANRAARPVITATQMVESMTENRRPTRAESTDVANAVLDGSDAVMLSEESALGKYPVEAVAMLARIAAATEPHRVRPAGPAPDGGRQGEPSMAELIAAGVEALLNTLPPAALFVPTQSGLTARAIARLKPQAWIVALSASEATCQQLLFSGGVYPVHEPGRPTSWSGYVRAWLQEHDLSGPWAILTEGPSSERPEANHRLEIIRLAGDEGQGRAKSGGEDERP